MLFPEYTGKHPSGRIAYAKFSPGNLWNSPNPEFPEELHWQTFDHGDTMLSARWTSTYDEEALYIVITDRKTDWSDGKPHIRIMIEPRRLWPVMDFRFNTEDLDGREDFTVLDEGGIRYVIARIPFMDLFWKGEELHPIRLDVQVDGNTWCPSNLIPYRLTFGTQNPADLGWHLFHEK